MLLCTLLLILIPALLCYRRALTRNHPRFLYLLLGATLSWGGVLIAWRLTREPLEDERTAGWLDRLTLYGVALELDQDELSRLESQAPVLMPELALARENGRTREYLAALLDFRTWQRAQREWQHCWLIALAVAVGLSTLCLGWLWVSVLPTFVQLFEGMSLELPRATAWMLVAVPIFKLAGPGLVALVLGLPLAWLTPGPAVEGLHRLRLQHACDPERPLKLAGISGDGLALPTLAAARGRLGAALETLLRHESRLPARRHFLGLALLAACLTGLLSWTLLAFCLPFSLLVGCLC